MVQKFAPLVKRQIEYWQRQIAFHSPDHPRYRPAKVAVYRKLVEDFGQLLEHLNQQEGTDLQPAPAPTAPVTERAQMSRSTGLPAPPVAEPARPARSELADLPPELLAELSGGSKGETDPIIKIIQDHGGTATLDEILIDLYRKYGEIAKRTITANKLYRLSKRELCWSLPGRKGIYTTTKPAEMSSNESDEGSDAATSEPSPTEMGAADLPAGPVTSTPIGSTPFASTQMRRKVMSETLPFPLRPDQKDRR